MFDIIADSACDITPEEAAALGVTLVPFYVSPDGVNYSKEGSEYSVKEFYNLLLSDPKAHPKTSLPSLDDYCAVFEACAKAGRPALCLCYTSKMSGSVGSARNARNIVLDDYPDAQLAVMDSTAATVTQNLMVQNAVSMRNAGCSLHETVEWLEGVAPTNQIFFTVGNLDYLIRGGRIGKAKGVAANLMNIKPMIHFHDGEIFSGGVARGRAKSLEKAQEQLLRYLEERNADPDDYLFDVGYGDSEEEGELLRIKIEAALKVRYPQSACRVTKRQIGCTIAVHTGPKALGVGVMRKWKPAE